MKIVIYKLDGAPIEIDAHRVRVVRLKGGLR